MFYLCHRIFGLERYEKVLRAARFARTKRFCHDIRKKDGTSLKFLLQKQTFVAVNLRQILKAIVFAFLSYSISY